jgi:putative phosphoribosyl transferase
MSSTAEPWPSGRTSSVHLMGAFRDRAHAGAQLAEQLASYRGTNPLVLALPRGGVPVAAEVARALDAQLDILAVRKLGAPMASEVAIGAVTADGVRVVNEQMIRELGISREYMDRITQLEAAEAQRQERRFRTGAAPNVTGRTVILVDDGLATGATMIAAARSVRERNPARLVIAVPVCSVDALEQLRAEADDIACLASPDPFLAVSVYYGDFTQVDDAAVEPLLSSARDR